MDSRRALFVALSHIFASLMLLVTADAFARSDNVSNALQAGQPASINLTLSNQADTAIRLEARAAPLGQILKALADKTGALIHYSVLPEAPVTATCVGANVGQVMDCLVAKQVGLVAHKAQKDKPAEFWLLGSSVGSCQALTVAPPASPIQAMVEPQPTPEEQALANQALQEQSDLLLEQAKAKDPDQRAEAITNLISGGMKDDPNVRKILEEALTDKDATIRANAITALAQREGEGAAEQLRQALNDTDVNVRMMVVDNAGNDSVLLQQALADKDPMIRDFAASKLEALNTQGKGN
ncbi:MAG: HEAT repeat domain-containing protein [Methyloglobulus sp.]|nr:HEAT repeat domain-containing protein [Methyloglobulus sp.]